ncbi:MAG: glycosyltransferase family 9 protein [Chloroherpetonaceae bacterium]
MDAATPATSRRDEMKQALKKIEYALKVALYKGVLARLFRNTPFEAPLNPSNTKRILILRRDMFGDMIITTALFKAIQDLNPKIEIDVIASQKGEQIIRHNPRLSRIWTIDNGLGQFLKTIHQARRRNYDAVICLSISGLTKDGLIANLVAPAAPKLTIRQPKAHNLYQILFNKEVDANHLQEPLWLSQKRVLDALFGVTYPEAKLAQELYPTEQAEQAVEDFLRRNEIEKGEYVVVNLSARMWYRRWGRDNFVAFLRELIYHYANLKVVLTATPDEAELVWGIMDDVRDENLFRFPHQLGLDGVIALTKHARLLVSPDTANVHIAATFKVPSVVLCTPLSSNVMWIPLHNRHISLYTPKPEPIITISPQQVFAATCNLLREIGIEPKRLQLGEVQDEQTRRPDALSGMTDAKARVKQTKKKQTIQNLRSRFYRAIFGNKPTLRKLNPLSTKRVLVIRNDVLGDMIVTTPIFHALKFLNPNIEIDVVASPQNAPLVQADSRISHVIVYEKSFRFWLKLWKLGRQRNYDAVFSLIYGTPQTQGFLANIAAKRNALKLSVQRHPKHECFFSRMVRVEQEAHIAEQWLSVALDAFELNGKPIPCQISLQVPKRESVFNFLKQNAIKEKEFILINLSAGKNRVKAWSKEKYRELIQRLTQNRSEPVVLSCAPNEIRLMEEVKENRQAICFYPTNDVRDVAELIRQAKLLITPDTGVVHLGSAMKTPMVVLYSRWVGGNVHQLWSPYQVPSRCLVAPRRLPVSVIEVEEVVQALYHLLSELDDTIDSKSITTPNAHQ